MTESFRHASLFSRQASEVFEWHQKAGSLDRMLSGFKAARFCSFEGARLILKLKVGLRWHRCVFEYKTSPEELSGSLIRLEGPFCFWSHTFTLIPKDEKSCELVDSVNFALPFWISSSSFAQKLDKFFKWRHRTLREDLAAYAQNTTKPLRILISGSHGLIGSTLIPFLKVAGHQVVKLVRTPPKAGSSAIWWDPSCGQFEKEQLENFDVVIHLAGESIAGHWWTSAQKKKLFVSRCRDTWLLTQALLST